MKIARLVMAAAAAALSAWIWVPSPSLAGGRMDAEVTCQPAEQPLTYRCAIRLTDRESGEPVEGASFTMRTGMPSMPMAHTTPLVQGEPGGEPGLYRATLQFEMAGEWVIDIRTTAPARDQMLHRLTVHDKGEAGRHDDHGMGEEQGQR